MKKKIILLFLIVIIFTSGCSKNDSKTLNVLNWSSYIPDSVIHDFEKETGIAVNYQTYSSNEELLAKVSSAKDGTYDLIFPSDYMVELLKKRNFIEKLDKTKLKNYYNINSNYLNLSYDSDNEYSIPFLVATTVIAYNKENIKGNITGYNDLLNNGYINNIVMLDDQRIVIGMALLALGYDMNSTDVIELQEAKDWLLNLKKNIKAYDSDSPKTFLISKEVDIGLLWNAEAAIAKRENPNIEVVYPKEGFAVSIDNFTLVKGAKNKDNAYKFIDYILEDKVMKQIIEDYPYKNVNQKTDMILSEEYLSNNAANISDDVIRYGTYVNNIGSAIVKYDKLWAEIK